MALSRLLVVAVIVLAEGASAGRIIALPLCGAPSHVFIMWKVCRELTARGHAVKVKMVHSSYMSYLVLRSLSQCLIRQWVATVMRAEYHLCACIMSFPGAAQEVLSAVCCNFPMAHSYCLEKCHLHRWWQQRAMLAPLGSWTGVGWR